jgi:hypothetical protein
MELDRQRDPRMPPAEHRVAGEGVLAKIVVIAKRLAIGAVVLRLA